MVMRVHGSAAVSRTGREGVARTTKRAALGAAFALCASAGTPALAAQAESGAPEVANEVWEQLADCESGSDWAADTGNGYYGGLQFDERTWSAYGGDRFAGYAHEATAEQQISVGEAVRVDRDGYGAWPACARQLDLPL